MKMTDNPLEYFVTGNTGVDNFEGWYDTLPEKHPCKYCAYSKARPCVGICYKNLMAEFRAKQIGGHSNGKQIDSLH